jgi:hypothetical protein
MDLRQYYQKIRDVESKLLEEFPIVVSKETPDGGKDGTLTEVPKRLAAKLIVDGVARLANAEQTTAFKAAQSAAQKAAEALAAASKVQVTVLASSELERLKNAVSSK